MRKGKMSIHIADVKKIFSDFAAMIQTGDLGDLADDVVDKRIEQVNK